MEKGENILIEGFTILNHQYKTKFCYFDFSESLVHIVLMALLTSAISTQTSHHPERYAKAFPLVNLASFILFSLSSGARQPRRPTEFVKVRQRRYSSMDGRGTDILSLGFAPQLQRRVEHSYLSSQKSFSIGSHGEQMWSAALTPSLY